MAIRVPSRTRLEKYGYVERGDGSGGPLDVGCPVLIAPADSSFELQEAVTFTWQAVDGATSYNFYLWASDAAEPTPINTTSLTYSTTLTFGITYRWRVTAVNDFGESSGCTYGLAFPSLPPGKSGYNEFDVAEGFINLEDDTYVVDDGAGSVTINIIRQGQTGAASCLYATADDTAIAPGDYTDTNGTATWANQVQGAFPVAIPIEPLDITTEWTSDILLAWVDETYDPRAELGTFEYKFDHFAAGDWYDNLADAKADLEAISGFSVPDLVIGWHRDSISQLEITTVSPMFEIAGADNEILVLHLNRHSGEFELGTQVVTLPAAGNICTTLAQGGISPGDDRFYWSGQYDNGTIYGGSALPGVWQFSEVVGPGPDYNPPVMAGPGASQNCTAYPDVFAYFPNITGYADSFIDVRRTPQGPLGIPGTEFPDWEHCPAHFTYDIATDTLYSKEPWVRTDGEFRWLALYEAEFGQVVREPMPPVRPVGHADDNEAFWTAARDAAVLAGTLSADVDTYDVQGDGDKDTYPRNAAYAWTREYKMPLRFTFSISDAVNAVIIEPDMATVWIVGDC